MILFNYLLLLALSYVYGRLFVASEVDYVCNSESIDDWNRCSHEWGKEQYECLTNNGDLIPRH